MATFISNSPAETEALGAEWGRTARRGWVLGLFGDLGAGKTSLVRGLARGLGSSARVHSPTFALVHEYLGGTWPLAHLDLYRLETPDQIMDAGLAEYFYNPEGVVAVEWMERWAPLLERGGRSERERLPLCYRQVSMEVLDDVRRRITYEDFGD